MKLTLAGIGAAGVAGLWIGYTKAAFFLPGWTLQRLWHFKPSAEALGDDFPKEAA